MMTALRRRTGVQRYVARGRIVGEIPSKQIRAGASKDIVGEGAWLSLVEGIVSSPNDGNWQ